MHIDMEPGEIRRIFAESPDDIEVCRRIAENSHVPFKVLADMADSTNPEIAILAASHPETSVSSLQKLLQHQEIAVRCAVATNRQLTQQIAMALTKDPAPQVRLALAKNPKSPPFSAEPESSEFSLAILAKSSGFFFTR